MNNTFVRIAAFFCAIILWIGPGQAYAQDPRLDNIIVTNTRDDLLLYLTAKDAFPSKIVEAIHSGVPATFTFFITQVGFNSFSLFPDFPFPNWPLSFLPNASNSFVSLL